MNSYVLMGSQKVGYDVFSQGMVQAGYTRMSSGSMTYWTRSISQAAPCVPNRQNLLINAKTLPSSDFLVANRESHEFRELSKRSFQQSLDCSNIRMLDGPLYDPDKFIPFTGQGQRLGSGKTSHDRIILWRERHLFSKQKESELDVIGNMRLSDLTENKKQHNKKAVIPFSGRGGRSNIHMLYGPLYGPDKFIPFTGQGQRLGSGKTSHDRIILGRERHLFYKQKESELEVLGNIRFSNLTESRKQQLLEQIGDNDYLAVQTLLHKLKTLGTSYTRPIYNGLLQESIERKKPAKEIARTALATHPLSLASVLHKAVAEQTSTVSPGPPLCQKINTHLEAKERSQRLAQKARSGLRHNGDSRIAD